MRPHSPLLPGRALNPRVQRELRRANHLMSIGDHLNAAEIFVDISSRAQDIGIVYPVPMLLMQAAHAYLMGEAYAQSIEQARSGLNLLADQERWRALKHEGDRYIKELEGAGQQEEAKKLRTWLDETLAGKDFGPASPKGQLPEKCPYCGASMSLEAIADHRAAECQYCGSVVLPRSED